MIISVFGCYLYKLEQPKLFQLMLNKVQSSITLFTIMILSGALVSQALFYSFYGINVFYYSTFNELTRFFVLDFIVISIPVLLLLDFLTTEFSFTKERIILTKNTVPKSIKEFFKAHKLSYLKIFIALAYVFENSILYTPLGLFAFIWLLVVLLVTFDSARFMNKLYKSIEKENINEHDVIRKVWINIISFYFILIAFGSFARFLSVNYERNVRKITITWKDRQITTSDTLRKIGELDKYFFLYNKKSNRVYMYSKDGLISEDYHREFWNLDKLNDVK